MIRHTCCTIATLQLQKKLDGYRKDNENLVIKYAFVEKKVLDLKALVGDKDSQLKRHEQEVASLQKQIGTLKADKAKLQKNIESKVIAGDFGLMFLLGRFGACRTALPRLGISLDARL